MTCKALVITDDPQLVVVITDALDSLEHEWDTACSLAEAWSRLRAGKYDYILVDISIPARAQNGHARIQNLENLLERLAGLKHIPPIIVMSDYAATGLEETVDVMRLAFAMHSRGVVDIIAKPFPDKGRTLDRVIKKVLAGKVERVNITWPEPDAKDKPSPEKSLPTPEPARAAAPEPAASRPAGDKRWGSVPNEAVELDDFMAKFCEQRSKENRACRKRALLAAARHGTVELPPLVAPRKHGQPNRYFVHGLLVGWPGFINNGVDLPPLLPQWRDPARGSEQYAGT